MNKMERTMSMSEQSKAIVEKFMGDKIFDRKDFACTLMATMYSKRDGAKEDILASLQSFVKDSLDGISEEELISLLSDYPAVISHLQKIRLYHGYMSNNEQEAISQDIVKLCSDLTIAKDGSKTSLFLPFAGRCEFLRDFNVASVHGFEINPVDRAFDVIYIDAIGYNGSISSDDESIEIGRQYEGNQEYDLIFSFPPILLGSEIKKIEYSCIQWLQGALKDNGTMCLLLPSSYLNGDKFSIFRRFLVEEAHHYSTIVFSIPSPFEYTDVKFSLVFIDKIERTEDTFCLINVDKSEFYAVDADIDYYGIRRNAIMDVIKDRDPRYLKIVNASELTGKYCLSPERYLIRLPHLKQGENYFSLGDLTLVPERISKEKGIDTGKVIGMTELSDNYLGSDIDVSRLETRSIKGFKASNPSGMFIGFLNNKMKVGRISVVSDVERVYLRGEVFQLFVRPESPAKSDFIMKSLLSDYVLKQAIALSSGSVLKRLSLDDLLSIKIIVPSLQKQDELLGEESKRLVVAAEQKLKDSFEDFRKDVHMKKHAVGQTIFNLNNWIAVLKQARRLGNGIVDDNAIIGKNRKIKVSEIYDNIDSAIETLSNQIKTFDIGYGMQTSRIGLADFIHDFIEHNQYPSFHYEFNEDAYRMKEDIPFVEFDDTDSSNVYAIEHKGEFLMEKGDSIEQVEFPKDALQIILQNIVANACAHGFSDENPENVIRISIRTEGTDHILVVENNGAPLHKDMDPEDIFKYSFSTGGAGHFGIGGYQIRQLMREFDGDAKVVSTPGEKFSLAYELTFHKTEIIVLW